MTKTTFTTKACSLCRSYMATAKKYQAIEIIDETLIVKDLITTIKKAK